MSSGLAQQERPLRLWVLAAFVCFAVGMGGPALGLPATASTVGFGGFVACIIGGIVTGHLAHARWRRLLAAQNYDWYRAQHPHLVTRDGVTCAKCGGKRIHVRGLMRRSYFREHFCTHCGAALYYSPEAAR